MRADGVSFGSEFLYPLVYDLRIAKCAEPAEEFARNLAHCRPGGIGVHLPHRGRDGAATANGHTQVMDGVRVGGRADVFQLLDDAGHPKGQAPMLRVRAGGKGRDRSHVQPRKSARMSSLRGDPCRTGPTEYSLGAGASNRRLWKKSETCEPSR